MDDFDHLQATLTNSYRFNLIDFKISQYNLKTVSKLNCDTFALASNGVGVAKYQITI